jgi:hypothetical protein
MGGGPNPMGPSGVATGVQEAEAAWARKAVWVAGVSLLVTPGVSVLFEALPIQG